MNVIIIYYYYYMSWTAVCQLPIRTTPFGMFIISKSYVGYKLIFHFPEFTLIPWSRARWPAGYCCCLTSWCTRGFQLWCRRCPCPLCYQMLHWPSSHPALSPAPAPHWSLWKTETQLTENNEPIGNKWLDHSRTYFHSLSGLPDTP